MVVSLREDVPWEISCLKVCMSEKWPPSPLNSRLDTEISIHSPLLFFFFCVSVLEVPISRAVDEKSSLNQILGC